jgi:hypothetical protein
MNRFVLPLCVAISIGVVNARAQAPPRLVPFSGVVVDAAGQPRTGTVALTFSLYDVSTEGTPLWTETQAVALDARGRYEAILGATTDGLPAELFRTGVVQWLGVRVDAEAEQSRVQLLAVPYAVAAAEAATLGGKPATDFVLTERLHDAVRQELKSEDDPRAEYIANGIPKYDFFGNLVDSNIYDVNGNVGIGTPNPNNLLHLHNQFGGALLQITNATTGSGVSDGAYVGVPGSLLDLHVHNFENGNIDFFTNDAFRMRVTADGSVGIGTQMPNYPFQLHRAAGHSLLQFTNATTGSGPGDGSYFGVLSGETLFRIYNLENANIEFFTNNQRRLTVGAGGNIGIGTQYPNYLTQLHSAGGHALLQLTNTTTGMGAGDGAYFGVLNGSPMFRIMNQENAPIEFFTNGVRRLTITTAGNLAIDGGGGGNNTGVGTNALDSLTTGSDNTALGSSALTANTTGFYNTALGARALASNTTGQANTALGLSALEFNTANENTAVGFSALQFNTTGESNTAVGGYTLTANTTGQGNTAVGLRALSDTTTGNYNAAFGWLAMDRNTTGFENTAVGQAALFSNTTGSSNTVLGKNALSSNTTGCLNVAIGGYALSSNQVGCQNTAVGYNAGGNATGTLNVYINHAGVAAESGRIRIGTAGYQTHAFIAGIRGVTTGVADAVAVVIDSNGQLGTISSSRRYKEDIHDVAAASRPLLQLRPVTFRYTQPYADGSKPRDYGLVAEEVAEVFPDLVVRDADGQPETVQYHKLSVLLLNELQRQQRQIDDLLDRIQDLERDRR